MKHAAETNKVIAYTNLPATLKLPFLIAAWLLMDRLGAHEWAFYVFYAFAALMIIGSIQRMARTTMVDIFAPVLDQAAPEVHSAAKDDYRLLLVGQQIEIERTFIDQLVVKIRDRAGKVIYTFDPYTVGLGETLRINDVQTELKIRYDH